MARHLPLFGAFIFSIFVVAAVANVSEITKTAYEKRSPNQGVVLLAVNWGRLWGVNGYENAELRAISFDLAGTPKSPSEKADLVIEGASGVIARIATRPVFVNYATLLPAGRYLMSGFDVKVAKSVSSIFHIKPDRMSTVVDGVSKLGYFEVKAGEIVYIGNFYLDRAMEPFIWRYYSPRPEGFKKHMAEFHAKYPFLPVSEVVYRLFETSTIGEPALGSPMPNPAPEPAPTTVTAPAGQELRRP